MNEACSKLCHSNGRRGLSERCPERKDSVERKHAVVRLRPAFMAGELPEQVAA